SNGISGKGGGYGGYFQGTNGGVYGQTGTGVGCRGDSTSNAGVFGLSTNLHGVYGTGGRYGGYLQGTQGGVYALSAAGVGCEAHSTDNPGVYGVSKNSNGVSGNGGAYGGHFQGGLAAIRLAPQSYSGKPTTGAHLRGELLCDAAGVLWFCTSSGTPGTWKKVTLT